MTVKELIENLQCYDGELPVFVKVPDETWPLPIDALWQKKIEGTKLLLIYANND